MKVDNLRAAIYDKLINNATLMSAVEGVYSPPVAPEPDPENEASFPYVVIGDVDAAAMDTKTDNGAAASVTISAYTMSGGMIDVEDINDRIYLAMHKQTITIAGAHFIQSLVLEQGSFPNEDGETQTGVSSLLVQYDEI